MHRAPAGGADEVEPDCKGQASGHVGHDSNSAQRISQADILQLGVDEVAQTNVFTVLGLDDDVHSVRASFGILNREQTLSPLLLLYQLWGVEIESVPCSASPAKIRETRGFSLCQQ